MKLLLRILMLPVAGVLLFVGLVLLIYVRAHFEHNRILQVQVESLATEVSHPEPTVILASRAQVTKSRGNGGNCFYFAGQVRRHNGISQVDVIKFYQNQPVELRFIRRGQFDGAIPDNLKLPTRWGLSSEMAQEKLYMVYTWAPNGFEDATFDLRCA
ncbi:hypothetical protein IQ266_01585 [filamentous cyanobacterium LEGE 11480]|uniref:Uncharacterized protein n=1 Tax=Romeriopsis navalis LEGE 11480 TaxID=2777977 RepID=A0A928VGZ8_9CYAN|nr:hypothetical protein [Romeriopsis navalis]MBE9028446.1 hypothetical protein [Romeriopsis navalis LEGE 11480]